jgi:hypothetical protein
LEEGNLIMNTINTVNTINSSNKDYKVFIIDDTFCVLTTTKQKAIDICLGESYIDEDDIGSEIDIEAISIKEVNYNKETWCPIEVLENIFSEKELDKIRNELIEKTDSLTRIKNGMKYYFEENPLDIGYIGVLLSFKQIMNTPEIFSEFELDSVICSDDF